MRVMGRELFTVGHSSHELSHFLGLLEKHGIGAVCDVRSAPYSGRNPQFNREALETSLRERGLRYVFLGRELGARSDDPSCYVDGQARYDRIARTESFQQGLERVRIGAESFRIGLMCAEADPLTCHRTILVCRELRNAGLSIAHIMPTGALEAHDEAEERLLRMTKLGNGDLFRPREELLSEAYRVQGLKIAYKRASLGRSTRASEVLR